MIPTRLRRWEMLVLLVVTGLNLLPLTGADFDYGRPPHGVRENSESPAAPFAYHGLFALIGLYCLWSLVRPDEQSEDTQNG